MKKSIIFFIFIISNSYSQNSNDKIQFDYIDNYVKSIKYKGDISKLVFNLTKTCKTDLEKSRAIFFWISENISYDYKAFNKKRKPKSLNCIPLQFYT